jgi:hypothetical protein
MAIVVLAHYAYVKLSCKTCDYFGIRQKDYSLYLALLVYFAALFAVICKSIDGFMLAISSVLFFMGIMGVCGASLSHTIDKDKRILRYLGLASVVTGAGVIISFIA